mmetsp:Transcript_7485/g.17227  ORF Transcript_7485/g.17227 Transcript_7485/m.17227 type:complete len:223 (-) Transcript_7485:73-741(-)
MPPSKSDDIDWLSQDACDSWCHQRRGKCKEDEKALELARDNLCRSQKETIVHSLCKLHKNVKNMTVKEFNEAYGCDVIDMITKQMTAGDVSAISGKKRTASFSSAFCTSGGLSLKTPAPRTRTGKPPMTQRTVRKGEITYSANGSPVGMAEQGEMMITAKKLKAGQDKTPFPISIGVGGGDGEIVDITDPDQRRKMNGEQKQAAFQQLKAMQQQMESLMEDW